MINNEFRLIGTIVSDFEEVPNSEQFPKKRFYIEVESRKFPRKYPVIVHEKNGLIDTTKSLEGSVAIVSGYVDVYKDYLTLISQDIVTVGVGKPKFKEIKPVVAGSGIDASLPSGDKDEVPSLDAVEPTDEDLPF